MDVADKILNNYLGLLERLNPVMKKKLIEQLKESAKPRMAKSTISEAFGAWQSQETAEELIDQIQKSRSTNRQIEKL